MLWIDSGGVPVTSYANAGGQGDRTASITVSVNAGLSGHTTGAVANLVDGSVAAGHVVSFGTTGFSDADFIRFDFGTKKYIDEITLKNDRALSSAWGTWKLQGSNDASAWVDFNSFAWDLQTEVDSVVGMDPSGYRYFQLLKVGATTPVTDTNFGEVEFKIAAGA